MNINQTIQNIQNYQHNYLHCYFQKENVSKLPFLKSLFFFGIPLPIAHQSKFFTELVSSTLFLPITHQSKFYVQNFRIMPYSAIVVRGQNL